MNSELVGLKVSKIFNVEVELLQVLKPVPSEHLDDFKEWLLYTGLELGLGRHFEYYTYSVESESNTTVDIPCEFYVKTVKL